MPTVQLVVTTLQYLRGMEFQAAHNIPSQGAALMVVSHSSPVDLLFCLALLRHVGRSDGQYVVSADMLDKARFRRFTESALLDARPRLGPLATLIAMVGAPLVPRLLRQVDVIPIFREGDDSGSRQQVLDSLMEGRLVTIAPERGNDSNRDATGLRPLTHGVAAIARRFFELTRNALPIVPVALTEPGRPFWGKVRVRVGAPYASMSDVHYPALFGEIPAGIEQRREAYQRFTSDLAQRLRELIGGLSARQPA